MLKTIAKIEFKINERIYQLFCENDSPLNDIKEFLYQISKYVGKCEDKFLEMKASQIQENMPPMEYVENKPEGE